MECALCGATEGLSVCSRCRAVWYCSVAHQREHWPTHKPHCRPVATPQRPDPSEAARLHAAYRAFAKHPELLRSSLPATVSVQPDAEARRVAAERAAFQTLFGGKSEAQLFPALYPTPEAAASVWDRSSDSLCFDTYVVRRLLQAEATFRASADWLGWAFLVSHHLRTALDESQQQLAPPSFVLSDAIWADGIGVGPTPNGGATAFDLSGRSHYYHL